MGGFRRGGGPDPAVLEALRQRFAQDPGGRPPQFDELPMQAEPLPKPMPRGGRQDLSGVQTRPDGSRFIMGRGGREQDLGRAAAGRVPPPPSGPIAMDVNTPETTTMQIGDPGMATARISQMEDGTPQPIDVGGPRVADPRIMEVLDRVRTQVTNVPGGGTRRALPPGLVGKPGAGGMAGRGGGPLSVRGTAGPAPALQAGKPTPAPNSGPFVPEPAGTPMAKPSMEGPAFDDMLEKIKRRGGIAGGGAAAAGGGFSRPAAY